MVDTVRGKVRVRAWPKKRGTPKSPAVRSQNAWFKGANRMAKYIAPEQTAIAIRSAKGTGFYPRDLILNAMSGGLADLVTPEGRVLTSRRPFLEEVMFQGCILEADANTTLPAATYTPIPFPLPVLDTAGFWNAGEPTRLTIPAGIEVVELVAGWRTSGIALNGFVLAIIDSNMGAIAYNVTFYNGWPATTVSTGPVVVSEGDWFRWLLYAQFANETRDTRVTFLKLNVLQVP